MVISVPSGLDCRDSPNFNLMNHAGVTPARDLMYCFCVMIMPSRVIIALMKPVRYFLSFEFLLMKLSKHKSIVLLYGIKR